MPKLTKFMPGDPFVTVGELADWIAAGNWTYWNHKPLHPGWLVSQPLRTLKEGQAKGIFRRAVLRDTSASDLERGRIENLIGSIWRLTAP